MFKPHYGLFCVKTKNGGLVRHIYFQEENIILQLCTGLAEMDSMDESSLYIFCLIDIILCSSLSDEANKIKPLNIERALNNFSYL